MGISNLPLKIQDEAGNVTAFPYLLKVPTGALTDNGDGTVSLATGIGDVAGPASSTDNAIVRFDGTGGSTTQDSGITIDDSNNLLMPTSTAINFNAGDVTLTHSANTLTLGGGNLALGTNSLTLTGSIASTGSRVTKGWFTDVESTNAPTVSGAAVYYSGGTDVAVADGGTGASTAGGARTNLGLGTAAVVNTDLSDLNEATIEAAIDTLANLTSIQGRTVTLADAGANAIFGWDDTASAYENLTQAEARTVLGLGTAAYVATDLSDLNEATIEAAIDTLASMTGAISTPTSITLSGTASTINAKNTSDSASVQVAIFEGDRATMADNDEAYVSLRLSNDAGTQKEFARLAWTALDVNAGTGEDGSIDISIMSAGTLTGAMSIEAGSIYPLTTDAMSLGTSSENWSDLFLDLGAVINFDGGDVTITHSANALDIDGGVVDFGSMPTVAGVSMLTISSTDTLSNKTLTAPKIANAGFIADANGNELIIFTTTASAVNEWTLANGSTGVNPTLTASGEANVGLDFQAKGTGTYRLLGTASQAAELRLYEDTDAGTNYTAFKVGTQSGDITYTLPTDDGDADQVLSTNGSGVLDWVTPSAGGGAVAGSWFSTDWSNTARTTQSGVSTDFTFDANGLTMQTNANTDHGKLRLISGNDSPSWAIDLQWGANVRVTSAPTAGSAFWGMGNVTTAASGITFTPRHIGFKVIYVASTATSSATNADGTTETATSFTNTGVTNHQFYHAVRDGSTNIKYYLNQTLVATHTTNMPTGATSSDGFVCLALSPDSTNSTYQIQSPFASWFNPLS